MAKVNTSQVGNQFRINSDGGAGEVKYRNAAWCSIRFVGTMVYIRDNSLALQEILNNPYKIELADFQLEGVDLNTESAIADALSTVLG